MRLDNYGQPWLNGIIYIQAIFAEGKLYATRVTWAVGKAAACHAGDLKR